MASSESETAPSYGLNSKERKPAGKLVRKVTTAEYKPAALALAEAFVKDDVARFVIDTPDRAHWSEQQKWDLHLSVMEYITYAHCTNGLVTTVGPDYSCVALWLPPGANTSALHTTFLSGLWRLYYKLSRIGRHRLFREFFPVLHDTKEAVLGHERSEYTSWYLVYIGTRPAARGKGYAKMLIRDVTRRADEEGTCCYLESSNVVNLRLYRGLGFEVRKQIWLSKGGRELGVPLDIMVREPSQGKAVETEKALVTTDAKGPRGLATSEAKICVCGENSLDVKRAAPQADRAHVKLHVSGPHSPMDVKTKSRISATGSAKTVAGLKTLTVVTTEETAPSALIGAEVGS